MFPHEEASFSVRGPRVTLDNSIPYNSTLECNTTVQKLQEEISTKFLPKKKSSLLLSDVYHELDMLGRSFRVADCGSFLEFHVTENQKKLHTANFCKDRLCPMCNWRRSLKIFGQVSSVMNVLEKQGYKFLFLTLTVRNCSAEDLPDTVQMLFDGWRNLYHVNRRFKRAVKGAFRNFECTRNKETGLFHPHLHVILSVSPDYFKGGNYITQAEFSNMWRSCCDLSYDPVVDVRKVKPDLVNGLSGAVAEVAKYAVKSNDFLSCSMDDMTSYVSAFLSGFSGRRLASFTGCFAKARKQLALDDVEDGDLVDVDGFQLRDDVAYMVVRYGWRNGSYVFI